MPADQPDHEARAHARARSRIRKRRRALDLSLEEIEHRSANTIPRWKIQRWECGAVRNPHVQDLVLLAAILSCSVDELIEDWFRPDVQPQGPSVFWLIRNGQYDATPDS